MADVKLKLLDDLCDKLDESGIEGNVIERDSCGRPYVNIWYGSFNDHDWHLSEMFTVVVTDDSLYSDPRGCYEIKPPNKYYDYFNSTFRAYASRRGGFYVMSSDQIIRVVKDLFNKEKLKETPLSVRNFEQKLKCIINGDLNLTYTMEELVYINRKVNKIRVLAKVKSGTFESICKINVSMIVSGACCYVEFFRNPLKAANILWEKFNDIYRTTSGNYRFTNPNEAIEFIKEVVKYMKIKKENNMSEFTLETTLFRRLKENAINYKFINGVYNPEKIVITTKMNHDICTVRSIPYSEDSDNAYEVRWTPVPTHILIDLKIDSVKQYVTSGKLIEDILRVERELRKLEIGLKPIEMSDLAYTKADEDVSDVANVLATEVIHKYRNYGIVDVIFNDPATIVMWSDGSKTVVKAENERFDPEKGLAMAISKKVLGNKHDYYEVFKKYVGRYEKKQKKSKKEN